MVVVLTVLGVALVAYGALMAALYPAGGFFLVWIAMGGALLAASRVERVRLFVWRLRWASLPWERSPRS